MVKPNYFSKPLNHFLEYSLDYHGEFESYTISTYTQLNLSVAFTELCK